MRKIVFGHLAMSLVLLLVSGCALFAPQFPAGSACTAAAFTVDDQFDGARRGACIVHGDAHVRLTILPENSGYINDSAWFSFRLTPAQKTTAVVDLRYRGGHHRYQPKTSYDGVNWARLPESAVTVDSSRRRAQLRIPLGEQAVFVSAHELVLPDADASWLAALAASSGTRSRVLGTSIAGNNVSVLESGADKRELIMLVGRQHPPEVSGAYGMKAFVETVVGDTPLAHAFRERFGIVAIPMLNPDGVKAGHWRHNLGGKDLNRDWGPFAEPETQLALGVLDQIERDQRQLRVFLDFHSTRRNLFYTQPDHDASEPTDFALRWFEAARAQITDYPFEHQRRHNEGAATSKNYVNQRFGIPAITYEVGDETPRDAAADAAVVFANAMMRLLLASAE